MTAPTVSVIVPAYRASGTIGRALESLSAQTQPPDEILVVDDGSPDAGALRDCVKTYRASGLGDRLHLLHKANGGAASARNCGLDQARGEMIAFLDADDYWEPTRLEKQLLVFEKHPEVGLCAGQFYTRPPDTEARFVPPHVPPEFCDRVLHASGARAFRIATCIWTSTVLVRRTVLGTNRFDAGLPTAEDIDLWFRLVLAAPVYLFREPLATQVQTVGSLSRSDVASDSRNLLSVVRRHAALLGRRGARLEEARVFRQWAAGHLGEGQMRKALGPAWQRLLRQPFSPQAWWIVIKSATWSCTPWGSPRKGDSPCSTASE